MSDKLADDNDADANISNGQPSILDNNTDEVVQSVTSTATHVQTSATVPVTATNTDSPTPEIIGTSPISATEPPTSRPTVTLTATASATNTSSPTNTVAPTATTTLPPGFEKVTSNAQWKDMGGPIEQEFDEVMMVLVPAGCFDMGST